MKIIQVAESLMVGDAVANDVVAIDTLLKQKGIDCGIFVTNVNNIHHTYINNIAKPINQIPNLEKEDILLLHHAIANDFCYEIPNLKCRKVLIYHNITPPHFFENLHSGLRDATQKGLDQLRLLNNEFECCIACSEFNKQDLQTLGYNCQIYVCPVLIPWDDYNKKPSNHVINKYSDDWENILFVGRLSPNKKQEDIIHAFALYKKYYNNKSRLFLVGSDGIEQYVVKLRKYIKDINVNDVIITGSLPFEDILAYYSIANVFVCMSEHEGFCVPLVEAMFFNIPILAYSSCAIPETMSYSGIILKDKNFFLVAGWINQLISNTKLKDIILEKQQIRLRDFSYDNVKNKMCDILNDIINYKTSLIQGSEKSTENFDLLMPIKVSDWNNAKNNIALIRENINPKKIIIIASKELKKDLIEDNFIKFIDENELVPGMTLESVRQTLKKAGGNPDTAGWFLQQFLKYGYSTICNDDYFLVWDADTLPINKISFFNKKNNKPYFNLKREYVPCYFDTLKNLLGIDRTRCESFITEHMLFNVNLCKKLIQDIESKDSIKGNAFWEKCIFSCNFNENKYAFSEYETYGNYITKYYPDTYDLRKLRTLRCGTEFLGYSPSKNTLNWVAQDFDTVSFEHWSKPLIQSVNICNNYIIKNNFKFIEILNYIFNDMKIKACLGTNEDKENYLKLLPKLEFDYYFGSKTMYELYSQTEK